jgi:hypothetical protein
MFVALFVLLMLHLCVSMYLSIADDGRHAYVCLCMCMGLGGEQNMKCLVAMHEILLLDMYSHGKLIDYDVMMTLLQMIDYDDIVSNDCL